MSLNKTLYYHSIEKKISLTVEQKQTLDLINTNITSLQSLEEMIDFLFYETKNIIPCDRIGIAFLEENGTRLRQFYVTASYSPLFVDKNYTAELKGSSLEKIFSSLTPRIINNLEEYLKINPESESTKLLLKEGVRSSMTCPLISNDRPVGVIFRSSRETGSYSKVEIEMHLRIAEHLSQAVEKAYRIKELTETNNAYNEMLSFVTHELKSPLSSIITMGMTLGQGYLGDLNEKQNDFVERMIKQGNYLTSLIEEYLNLARFETGQGELINISTVPLSGIIDQAIEIINPQISSNRIKLEKNYNQNEISVSCDADMIKIVAVNLLSNAVKYGNYEGLIRITIRSEKDKLAVSVWNQGPGFSRKDKYQLFRKFSRLKKKELLSRKGSGIGLYVSWKIIQLHEGRMWADSLEGEWAEFGFELPILNNRKDTDNGKR